MHRIALLLAVVCLPAAVSAQQQLRFDDVVRNLRNPDPKTRLSAIHLLRDAKYPEAIAPIAPLVLDPIDEVQLEAIDTELAFFLEQDVRSKKMLGGVIEQRKSAIALAAFEQGPYAVWPRTAPPELVTALLQAVDDENQKVRLEAIYATGVIAKAPLAPEQVEKLIKALDHYDPAVRAAAARVIGRINVPAAGDALLKAVNDSQADVRYASMRALGAIKDVRAVNALNEQLVFYKKGEGAWSALEALARIGAPATIPVFRERMIDKDPYLRRAAIEGLGRAGDKESLGALEKIPVTDESPTVRLAALFALQKLGRNTTGRIADMMGSPKLLTQGQDYLVEIGPSQVTTLVPRLQEPDADVREAMADVLGIIGDAAVIPPLQAALKDRDASVAAAAKRAIAKIQAR
jgi:HEAT repeat protein